LKFFFASEFLKPVALIVIAILGHSAECETKVMDPFPWLMAAAVVPMAWLLLCATSCFVYHECHYWNSDFMWDELCVMQLVVDFLFGTVWFSIGIYIASQLDGCPERGIIIASVAYFCILVGRSIAFAVGLLCGLD